MLSVIAVFSRATADGTFSFFAKLEQGGKAFDLPVTLSALMSYRHFQSAVLSATGQLPWLSFCEHRTSDDADSAWRLEVSQSLERESLKEQPAKQSASSIPVN